MSIDAFSVLCAQLTCDLFAIAKFLLHFGDKQIPIALSRSRCRERRLNKRSVIFNEEKVSCWEKVITDKSGNRPICCNSKFSDLISLKIVTLARETLSKSKAKVQLNDVIYDTVELTATMMKSNQHHASVKYFLKPYAPCLTIISRKKMTVNDLSMYLSIIFNVGRSGMLMSSMAWQNTCKILKNMSLQWRHTKINWNYLPQTLHNFNFLHAE